MNEQQFKALVSAIVGFHGFAYVTMSSLLKWGDDILVKGNPLCPTNNAELRKMHSVAELREMRPQIVKRTTRKLYVGPNIQARENRKAVAEGREPHVFGPLQECDEWVIENYILRNKYSGKLYLRATIESLEAEEYLVNGKAADGMTVATIREYKPKRGSKPPCVKISLDNLERLSVNGFVYEV